jgi:hypothetical protein
MTLSITVKDPTTPEIPQIKIWECFSAFLEHLLNTRNRKSVLPALADFLLDLMHLNSPIWVK